MVLGPSLIVDEKYVSLKMVLGPSVIVDEKYV
jgi:hypothetical protein